jgi:two-component system sensor histidine kinase GlrK
MSVQPCHKPEHRTLSTPPNLPPSKALKRGMELRYPRSFVALLLIGFCLAALPLIAGLISNAFSIERLSGQSQKAVYDATQATQNARQLSAALLAMERTARFYAADGDREMVESYRKSRDAFRKLLFRFMELPLTSEMRSRTEAIQTTESAVFSSLTTKAASSQLAKQFEIDFAELSTGVQALTGLSDQLIEREVDVLRASATKSKNQVFWQLFVIVPAVLLMIGGFTYLLSRPILDLESAIHRLGEGKLARRIRVSGPRDIEQLGEQLDWLRQRLITLEDQKTRFFQHVSHELKTPLTALREGSELLSDGVVGKLSEEQREVAEIMKQNSLTLEKLIQDLLTYSQSQSPERINKKTAMAFQALQLGDLIGEVVEAHKIASVAKAITIERDCDAITVQGDPAKLRVVIDNLLSNAIKYSPEGGTVLIRLGKHRENAVLEVLDNGPGIADEDRSRIFDPFYRSKSALASGKKGTGLGLAIVRDYVELHHGTVSAVAAVGARIRVILPNKALPETPVQRTL